LLFNTSRKMNKERRMATASASTSQVCAYQTNCILGDKVSKKSGDPAFLRIIMPCDHVPPTKVHDKCFRSMGTTAFKCSTCLSKIQKSPVSTGVASKWQRFKRSFSENPADTIVGAVADGIDYATGAAKQVINDNLDTKIGMANRGEFQGSNFVEGMNSERPKRSSQHYAGERFRNTVDQARTAAKQLEAIGNIQQDPLKAITAAKDLTKTAIAKRK